MIVWSGKGIFAILFLGLGALIGSLIPDFGYKKEVIYIFASLGGVFTWHIGRKWNKEVIYYDEPTQQYYKTENENTLFWIPMQYVGILGMIGAIGYLIDINLTVGIIWTVWLIYFTGYSYFERIGWTFTKSDKQVMSKSESTERNIHKPSSGGWESRQGK
ncbi:hypothetical protein LNQ81_02215 [Myroides sp. M-43]|uniref:hypothetical protein n=1 Tax=Myroides oncorhynchi TaxID=2893756 RepID=UPI001E2F5FDC|nr:hypothetical protein [Myroides oncorhynchi]MCC9041531.1 hypothetical protein [Myroides oncorhynchi]